MREYINNGIGNLSKQGVKSNIPSISREKNQYEFLKYLVLYLTVLVLTASKINLARSELSSFENRTSTVQPQK